MALRCLLFSSDEAMVQPIWQVLADLGVEGEYCGSAVDAVERVTTQLFQIVITDWEDQPEAAFLLKTARDLKAANRPLTLAIVREEGKLPEALKAGANSVLLKPIRPEQVRDTLGTACELLRAKLKPSSAAASLTQKPTAAMAASASTGTISMPVSVMRPPEKAFRAGEFLQSASSEPGAQFDTDSEVKKELAASKVEEQEMDALTDLEPTAAAVGGADVKPASSKPALTGWASLQERLAKPAPQSGLAMEQAVPRAEPKAELLSYGETASYGGASGSPAGGAAAPVPAKKASWEKPQSETNFAPVLEQIQEETQVPQRPSSSMSRILVAGILAAASIALVGIPRARQGLQISYVKALRAAVNWLNPPPVKVAQVATGHDSFGQLGDEYKLPAAGNIPDATTDPSQIRVLPVIDPTAKTDKSADGNAAAQTIPANSTAVDPTQTVQNPGGQNPNAQGQAGTQVSVMNAPVVSNNPATAAAPQTQTPTPGNPVPAPAATAPTSGSIQSTAPVIVKPLATQGASSSSMGIPSSLKSQIASSTPDASGTKPDEAAMSSIEPVNVAEAVERGLLVQTVQPEYPAAAKASGQAGSVVLQVLIGRDGAVQDAKFLQGSLLFARPAIDAVKQWRFKPYLMNGRAVSVQSMITLGFKP